MIFTQAIGSRGAPLQGAYVIDLQKHEDHRGFFARAWCENEFKDQGIETTWVQANLAYSEHKGTLRGMHYQVAPYAEVKLMRCIRGAMYDVILDLRPNSPTFKDWLGVELTADNRRALYVPEGYPCDDADQDDLVDRQCEDGTLCEPEAAVCVALRQAGGTCSGQQQCVEGNFCDVENQMCEPYPDEGEPCRGLGFCAEPYECIDGTCALLDAGEPCRYDHYCRSGRCDDATGVCLPGCDVAAR